MKKFFNNKSWNVYWGYFFVLENLLSRKEGFEIGVDILVDDFDMISGNLFYEKFIWFLENGDFKFKVIMLEVYD